MCNILSIIKANRKLLFLLFLLSFFTFNGCVSVPLPSTIVITRSGTNLDDGKLYVYVDGKLLNKKQPIGKGQTRNISVSNGSHRIWVKVDNFESDKINFTVNNNTINFNASAQRIGGSRVLILEQIKN